ncbi:MAG TPA: tetratricopeptide repeat-containing serine protease family protein [Thermodesulfobacteriota bacterium]|nr:tetratricopeptide repeat-containing serine protease family protein [Thermodesulfobacteriota bacterium]
MSKFYGPAAAFLSLVLFASPLMSQENLPVLIKKVESSIVVIVTYGKEGNMLSQGTGFFVDQEGDVITNFHVLQEASRAAIIPTDGKEYPIRKVLAEDKEGDLVRVSTEVPKDLIKPLPISTLVPEVGERVIVIGTPLGLDKTVSDGIVSAVRDIPAFGKIIQLTAPISPGSSGSPVINMKGQVIGIATFFVVAGQNLNFAIPGERMATLAAGSGETLSQREEGRIRDLLASAEGLYATGLHFLWAEDYEKALPYFVETVKRRPDHAAAYFQLGYCLAKLGQYKEAIVSYEQSLRINPKEAPVHSNLCAAYGKTGRYDAAIESCKQAIRINPEFAEAYSNLGWSYQRAGRYEEAVRACKEAVRLKPDFAPAHYNLGNSYAALKKYGEAIDAFKEAIRIKFDYPEGHLDLGAAYFQTGRIDEAIESYKQAIELKPSLAEARLNLGMAYLKQGNKGSAVEEYKLLKELNKELANKLFSLIYE